MAPANIGGETGAVTLIYSWPANIGGETGAVTLIYSRPANIGVETVSTVKGLDSPRHSLSSQWTVLITHCHLSGQSSSLTVISVCIGGSHIPPGRQRRQEERNIPSECPPTGGHRTQGRQTFLPVECSLTPKEQDTRQEVFLNPETQDIRRETFL